MNALNDGGSITPALVCDQAGMQPVGGLTFRDYFAAAAMQGICANPAFSDMTNIALAENAFDTADAMLTERDKSKGGAQ